MFEGLLCSGEPDAYYRVMACEDLVDLPNRCTVDRTVEELSRRFKQGGIYTWLSGAPRYDVLVATNPFHVQHAPDSAETAALMRTYFDNLLNPSRSETVAIGVSPHVFAVIASALDALLHEKRKQSLIFIGESGSGKTFATSQCLRFLKYATERYSNRSQGHLTGNAAIRARRRRNKMPSSSSLSEHSLAVHSIESKLVEASTVLEAFGNARTLTNDNSSRFGKWMELTVDMSKPTELLKVNNARIQCFLLEANRVITQREGECGFHVFGFLLHGTQGGSSVPFQVETEDLGLDRKAQYKFLRPEADGSEDAVAGFEQLCRAVQALGFSEDEVQWMFRIAAAVLHLGNISFQQVGQSGHVDLDDTALCHSARLLGLSSADLSGSFVNKTLVVKGEHIVVPVSVTKASGMRNAFAKFVYKGLFRWVVEAVNRKLGDDEASQGNRLGLLDIFGFERLPGESNSLEQLCINYTNEVILHGFNMDVHEDEDEFYALEDIEYTSTSLHSNQHILNAVHSVFDAIQEHSMLTDKGSRASTAFTFNAEPDGVRVVSHGKAFVIQHSSGEPILYFAI